MTLIATCAVSVIVLMLSVLLLAVIGDPSMRSALLEEKYPAIAPRFIGIPSLGTVTAFMLAACGLIMWLVGNGPLRPLRRAMSLLTGFIGCAALFGHLTGIEFLYWHLPNTSSALAAYTAVGFIGLGIAVHEVEMDRIPKHLHK